MWDLFQINASVDKDFCHKYDFMKMSWFEWETDVIIFQTGNTQESSERGSPDFLI